MKRLDSHSQNFLRSPRLVLELIGHSTIKKSDTVLDIGAGSGVISSALATRCKQVIAYEYDSRVAVKLRDNMRVHPNVNVVEEDFLNAELPSEPYKIFSNIPFHLSSPILKKLTESNNRPTAIYLVVQKQFASKLLIDDARFTGLLGAQIASLYAVRIRKRLQKTDFWPRPAVDTVLVGLTLRETQAIPADRLAAYRQFVADCYADPKTFAKMPQSAANITPGTKPSQLVLDQWLALFGAQKTY